MKQPTFPSKHPQTPSKKHIGRILKFVFKLIYFGLIVFLVTEIIHLNNSYQKLSQSGVLQTANRLELLQSDLNEVKEYLLIPTTDNQEDEDLSSLSLDSLLKNLINKNEIEQLQIVDKENYLEALDKALADINKTLLDDLELELIEEDNLFAIKSITTSNQPSLQDLVLRESSALDLSDYMLVFGYNGSNLIIYTPFSQSNYFIEQLNSFSENIKSQLTESKLTTLKKESQILQEIKFSLAELAKNPSEKTTNLLAEKNVKLEVNQENSLSLLAQKSDFTSAFQLVYDPVQKEFIIEAPNKKIIASKASLQQLLPELEAFLEVNSFQTVIEQNIYQKFTKIKESLSSTEMVESLKRANLQTVYSENEEEHTIDFIEINSDNIKFSIKINKKTAEVTLEQEGKTEKIAFNADLNYSSSSSDEQQNPTSTTMLLAGKQGALTDTMMLAHLNETTQEVKLVSIPRDLYYKGDKVNAIYARRGMPALVETLENIFNQKIENYVLVDMYAFIDVVDAIGGITVSLDRDVVDPTYKTLDNGVWGTLYYPKGIHNLNGTQALRLARSRYTTSDFARAERQQMILESIKNKLVNLGFKGPKAIYQIATTLYNKTETDISLNTAIASFFRYKNFQIARNNVLSTANILESTYSNQQEFENCDQEECDRGAYILLPRNNDWSILKTYVAGILNN